MNARPPTFAATLRRFREQAGVSQELLAERAGLSLRGVSDLERGARTTPRLETVRMIADGLGLDDTDRAALFSSRNAARAFSPAPPSHGRLPVPATSFHGRTAEIAMISRLLGTRRARLVTLIGPGGVGKTRLAIEAGRGLADAFPDGVVFAGLAPLKSAELVLPTIAAALGAPDSGSSGLPDLLSVTLRDRTILLVLDNVEQVVDAAPDVAALLERCPTLSILATSRVILNIAAETVVPVAPLEITDVAAMASRTLDLPDAVALFVDRARAVHPEFRLTSPDTLVVADLVMRLEGLPLAIELAAARTRIMSPDALLARIDRQLPLLTGGGRDVPERHQTMRNTIAWSYDLLSPAEQAIFRRLSIFRAGCTLDAAEKILVSAGDLREEDVLDGVQSLVASSLLRRRQEDGAQARFVMLVAVREFGLEQLAAHGEEEVTREAAYQAWYRPLARKAQTWTTPRGQAAWLQLLESEHDNLRGVLSWLIDRDRIEDALDLSGDLWFFRWIRGHYAEARNQFQDLLRHPLGQARTRARGKALVGLGVVSMHQGDSNCSFEALREAKGIFRELEDFQHLSLALLCYGTAYLMTSQVDDAERFIEEALTVAIRIGDRVLESSALTNLQIIAEIRGDLDRSRSIMDRVVSLTRSTGETWGLSIALGNLGFHAMQDGNLDRAEAYTAEALELVLDLGDKRDLPVIYLTLSDIARLQGDLPRAKSMLDAAFQVARDIGDLIQIARCTLGRARLAIMEGDADHALPLVREASRLYREIGDDVCAVECLDLVADIATSKDDFAHAAWCLGAVDRTHENRGMKRVETSPGEHAMRVKVLVEALGEPGWRRHWRAGFRHDANSALEKGLAWTPSTDGASVFGDSMERASGLDR